MNTPTQPKREFEVIYRAPKHNTSVTHYIKAPNREEVEEIARQRAAEFNYVFESARELGGR